MRPLPSVQPSSWLTLSSRSTIILPRRKETKTNNELGCNVIYLAPELLPKNTKSALDNLKIYSVKCRVPLPEKAFMREGLLMVSTATPDSCLSRSMEPPGKACSFSLISCWSKPWMLEYTQPRLCLCNSLGGTTFLQFIKIQSIPVNQYTDPALAEG